MCLYMVKPLSILKLLMHVVISFCLPGAPYEEPSTPTSPTVVTPTFASGDRVKIQLEVEVFKMMQDGHGGWNDGMASVSVLYF